MAWRIPYIIQASVALVLVASCLLLPQSSRWLVAKGKREQAVKALELLDFLRTRAKTDIKTDGANNH